jgi:hypothetical protein
LRAADANYFLYFRRETQPAWIQWVAPENKWCGFIFRITSDHFRLLPPLPIPPFGSDGLDEVTNDHFKLRQVHGELVLNLGRVPQNFTDGVE